VSNEKTGEDQPLGQQPNAAVKRPRLRDSDPQAYAVFLEDLKEAAGLPPSSGTTIEEVVGNIQKPDEKSLFDTSATPSDPIASFINQLVARSDMSSPSAFDILKVCLALGAFLIDKNRKYGESALDPVRIMSSADPLEQIKVRMDDKLSRLYRGHLGEEDAMQDLVGYWVLLRVAEARAARKPE
jgi:hypothetical protein